MSIISSAAKWSSICFEKRRNSSFCKQTGSLLRERRWLSFRCEICSLKVAALFFVSVLKRSYGSLPDITLVKIGLTYYGPIFGWLATQAITSLNTTITSLEDSTRPWLSLLFRWFTYEAKIYFSTLSSNCNWYLCSCSFISKETDGSKNSTTRNVSFISIDSSLKKGDGWNGWVPFICFFSEEGI